MVQTTPHRAGDKEGARRFCAATLCPACPLANKGNPISHFSILKGKSCAYFFYNFEKNDKLFSSVPKKHLILYAALFPLFCVFYRR
jgi:hypothetical protein